MKLAISGKGGTGKTTIAASLAISFSKKGQRVILIDADPDTNLQITLGIKGEITPLIEMKSLIQERTETKPGQPNIFFKLNPKVDDIPEKFFLKHNNILLGVMGSVRGGGLGCTCPENAFLKSLLRHLILGRKDVVILDMEAGIEHLGRGTTSGIDYLLIITEPGEKSIETTFKIEKLGKEIGIKNIGVIGNKIKEEKEKKYIEEKLKNFKILSFINYYDKIREGEIEGIPPWEKEPRILEEMDKIISKL